MSNAPRDIPPEILEWMKAVAKERGPVPMPDRIFRHALGYHESSLRCLELRDEEGFLFQPSIVLFAFVIELYLKGLLALEEKETRTGGHNLVKIFAGLKDEVRGKIAGRYEARHGQALADDLPNYASLFVQHRYPYELQGAHQTDITGVAQLAAAIYETWAELRPDLIKPGVVHERITAANQGIPIVVVAGA